MSIFVDTAVVEEAIQAKDLGWVRGITTNPVLLAKSGKPVSATLSHLRELNIGPVFYQLTAPNIDEMLREVDAARAILGDHLVVKIPPVQMGFQIASILSPEMPCCITALYSVAQAIVARETGTKYIAVYVNRATRLLGDGITLLGDMARALAGGSTEILAASIKSSDEASAAMLAGADHLTLPFDILKTLITHDLSDKAMSQFRSEGAGIRL